MLPTVLITVAVIFAIAAIAARVLIVVRGMRLHSLEGAFWLLAVGSGCAALLGSISGST